VVTDPRVTRSRAKILATTADLIVELGIPATCVEHIAARSGVAKTTIYRHWPALPNLIVDAVAAALPPAPTAQDVTGYLCELADSLDARAVALIGALGAAARTDDDLAALNRDFVRRRREPLHALLTAAGHDDVETVLAALGGAVFYWRLVASEPVDHAAVQALVARVLPTRETFAQQPAG
jgi:DNA-binding transcriptional regulator YbjK